MQFTGILALRSYCRPLADVAECHFMLSYINSNIPLDGKILCILTQLPSNQGHHFLPPPNTVTVFLIPSHLSTKPENQAPEIGACTGKWDTRSEPRRKYNPPQ